MCENGKCTTPCTDGSQCPSGVCKNGRCVLPCTDNNECPSGLCQNGRCVSCSFNEQCQTNLCQNGACNVCTGSQQCSGGACQNGACTPANLIATNLVASAPVCGNGILEAREECDDTNRRDGDGCNESCLLEVGICGDGKVEKLMGEQCEASTFDYTLPYDCTNCRFVSRSCGDGKLDPGEECDRGLQNSTSPNAACRPDCSLSRCGDGIRDGGEECDDGNYVGGDDCDRYCKNAMTSSTLVADAIPYATPQTHQQQNNFPMPNFQAPNAQQIMFPQFQQYQNMPYQLPYGQLQPLLQQAPRTAQTGPAAVAAIGAGAAAGMSWVRRRRGK